MSQDTLMTVKQIAEHLQLKESTVYSWAQDNKIPAFKIGRTWRFDRARLGKWLSQHLQDDIEREEAELGGEQLMTVKQVGDYLQLKESTVYSWAQDEKIPAFKIGRTWRFGLDTLRDWLREHLQAVDDIEVGEIEDEQLMTVKQVADYLQLKESTIYSWAQDGRIPAFKIGRTWRFGLGTLHSWLERHLQDEDGLTDS
jgi:excisionase family DNA binding protein